MSSVPEEIYQEILLRVPVKSLLVCKCVCKNWYDLISSSNFVKLHLEFTAQKNKPILMLQDDLIVFKSIGYDSLLESEEDAAIEMEIPFKPLPENYAVELVGSCNGLVCIQLADYDDRSNSFCLWNPATREYKILPKSPTNKFYYVCALSYDHKIEDYKLVIGEHLGDDNTLIHIYTLTSNSWKPGKTVPYQFPNYTRKCGVLFNGDLHWLAKAQSKVCLLSLDISEESFKELQLPPKELFENRNLNVILGVLEGCLRMLVASTHCEVLQMLDYGVQESWTKRYIITHESIITNPIFALRPVWSFENGRILFIRRGSLVLYDPELKSAVKLHNHGSVTRHAVNYFESLVSLSSGTYVGGEGGIEELRET